MQNLKVEYLIILNSKGSFCNNIKTFNNLIRTNGDFSIKSSILTYKKMEVKYEVLTGEIEDKEQRYFHIKIICNDVKKIDDFQILLKNYKEIIYKTEGNINTIWNDISFFYCNNSYPLIYELENLLRKLITKFMLITIGTQWVDETLPNEVKNAIKTKKKERNGGYADILHEIDFINLADFLFKPYHDKDIQGLYKELKNIDMKHLDMNKLKSYIPKSNWEKYFSDIVDCEDGYLNKKWTRLYELRCMVAHNNFLSKSDYEEIIELSKELKEIIQKAVNGLDKISIPEEDKEEIAERVVSNINELYGSFIQNWKIFEHKLMLYAEKHNMPSNEKRLPLLLRTVIDTLIKNKSISKELAANMIWILQFRNMLVHHTNANMSEEELLFGISTVKKLIEEIDLLQ